MLPRPAGKAVGAPPCYGAARRRGRRVAALIPLSPRSRPTLLRRHSAPGRPRGRPDLTTAATPPHRPPAVICAAR